VTLATAIAINGLLGGDSRSGPPPTDLFPHVIFFALVILIVGVVGAVISAVINRGLIAMGLAVVGELTKGGGRRLIEKLAPEFVRDKWRYADEKSWAITRGFVSSTKWLLDCNFLDSEAIVSGFVIGMVSGATAYYLKSYALVSLPL